MPHAEKYIEFTPNEYPPFPKSGFKTVPLETVSLKKLLSHDSSEESRCFEICKGRGFFYLDLADCKEGSIISGGANEVARVAEDIFKLPAEEKQKYARVEGDLFGYKNAGMTVVDKAGNRDTSEFFNVAKNDMILPDERMRRQWPGHVMKNKDLFAEYCRTAHGIGLMIAEMLAEKLGIDVEDIRSRHRIEEPAGDHVRLTRGPARKTVEMPEVQTPSHTDFGTITLLMNWLGGLQVWSDSSRKVGPLAPDTEGEWLWVKPQPGCAIINLGDAAVKFTNGVLCSGRHRVIPAPGEQGQWPRYSVVYFVRPTDDCRLKTLKGRDVPPAEDMEEEDIRAKDWINSQANALITGMGRA